MRKLVTLMLVLAISGYASAFIGEVIVDHDFEPATPLANAGTAGAAADGTLYVNAAIVAGNGGQVLDIPAPAKDGSTMLIGGGRNPSKDPPTWADVEYVAIDFDVLLNDAYSGCNEPTDKQTTAAAGQ